MAPAIKNPFKRKPPANKDKVVLKAADKQYTEISIARVDKSRVVPNPAPEPLDENVYMDVSTLHRMLKQRDAQISSLKNEVADLTSRINELEIQASLCTCGAYETEASGPALKSHFSRWWYCIVTPAFTTCRVRSP